MKPRAGNPKLKILSYAVCAVLLGGFIRGAVAQQKFEADKKGKVSGVIQSRSGDLVTIQEKKGDLAVINLSDDTKIERKKDFRPAVKHPSSMQNLRESNRELRHLPLAPWGHRYA